jgi:hypothetical protein
MLAILVAAVSSLGPLALAGGPLGIALAWGGSFVANKTVKIVAICAGLLLLISVSVGLTIHIKNLEADRAAYKLLKAEHESLEAYYGCPLRAEHERDLGACLTARERDVEKARAEKLAELQRQAAQAQADLADATAKNEQLSGALDDFINSRAAGGDGPVPQVLKDYWAHERAERGHR